MLTDKFNTEKFSNDAPAPVRNFHAHIYYEPGQASEKTAKALAQRIRALFGDRVEDVKEYDVPGGPHRVSNVAVHITREGVADILPWLQAHHGDHAILLHPKTGDVIRDHIDFGVWLGKPTPGLLNDKYFAQKRALCDNPPKP